MERAIIFLVCQHKNLKNTKNQLTGHQIRHVSLKFHKVKFSWRRGLNRLWRMSVRDSRRVMAGPHRSVLRPDPETIGAATRHSVQPRSRDIPHSLCPPDVGFSGIIPDRPGPVNGGLSCQNDRQGRYCTECGRHFKTVWNLIALLFSRLDLWRRGSSAHENPLAP